MHGCVSTCRLCTCLFCFCVNLQRRMWSSHWPFSSAWEIHSEHLGRIPKSVSYSLIWRVVSGECNLITSRGRRGLLLIALGDTSPFPDILKHSTSNYTDVEMSRFQRLYEPQVCSVIRPSECSHSLPVITIQSGLVASEQTSSASLTTVVQHLATRESNSCCCCCLLQSSEVCRDLIKVHCDMLTTGWANS